MGEKRLKMVRRRHCWRKTGDGWLKKVGMGDKQVGEGEDSAPLAKNGRWEGKEGSHGRKIARKQSEEGAVGKKRVMGGERRMGWAQNGWRRVRTVCRWRKTGDRRSKKVGKGE
jgi:hypothetical protein